MKRKEAESAYAEERGRECLRRIRRLREKILVCVYDTAQ